MATVVVQQQPSALPQQSTTPPLTPALTLNTHRSTTPIPNKHIPYCSPGPIPSQQQQITPPNSPPSRTASAKRTSILSPPTGLPKLLNSPPIYGIDRCALAKAMQELSMQPMADPATVFPWLHGLHPDNHTQLAFFVARKKSLRKVPQNLRGITIIKAGGDLSRSRIKGAVAPDEIMSLCDDQGRSFVDCDPRDGFSVRNFHIQTAKMAQVSDIIVYGDDRTDHRIIKSVAERAATVQRQWKREMEYGGQTPDVYNTFVLTSTFSEFEKEFPNLIAVDTKGKATGKVIDFLQQERTEMCEMTRASQISPGVWMGPSPNSNTIPPISDQQTHDVFIECSDHAMMPEEKLLTIKSRQLNSRRDNDPMHVAFPSSGSIMPPSWSHSEADGFLRMCQWMYNLTHVRQATQSDGDEDGDIQMSELNPKPRRILVHCPDGYTETSLLSIAYVMYAEGLPLDQAWLRLHKDKGRNFFAYPSDVTLLKTMQTHILSESPALPERSEAITTIPAWLHKIDGSLPSRILPYMYLGNLTHANNPEMLKKLGIKRVLSIGEPVAWSKDEWHAWGRHNLMFLDRIQDNGIDELGTEIERCLEFISRGKVDGTATLVHCRVGVSRSATICIAEVMASMNLSFSRAYCFVRARRLNVIIQPHLRFVYELMKWDEIQQKARKQISRRDLEWVTVAREIAAMNRPYSRS